jgi:hypothetical protein
MIRRRKLLLWIGEVYFQDAGMTTGVDIMRYHQVCRPLGRGVSRSFSTLVIDLTQEEAQILGAVKKDCRSEIRRAAREGLRYQFRFPAEAQDVEQFSDFYDQFSAQATLPPANRTRLRAIAESGALDLSASLDGDGSVLTRHAYFRSPERTRLLHSASLYREADSAGRARIGRANRHSHWCDIIRHKQDGVLLYDFGGFHAGAADARKIRINDFKREFGGKLVTEFTCDVGTSAVGRMALKVRALMGSGFGI